MDWDNTLKAVPREAFAPDRLFHDGEWTDRNEHPQRWAELVASDIALTTQLDDGTDGNGTPTSSSSQPKVVRLMLNHLGAQHGMRVLDVGTGTGWTAGLLAHAMGDANVTTIEVDPTVAAQAYARLQRAGLHPRAVVGDGYAGHPGGAPYDRVHATAAVQRVPRAWIEQTRPGGIILVPFGTLYCNGALLRLVVGDDGSASGTFVDDVAFMWVRSQRPESKSFDVDDVRYSASTVDPAAVQQTHAAAFAIGLRLPGVTSMEVWAEHAPWGTGRSEVWDGTSYAHCRYADWDAPHAVVESGPRDLWSELAGAYRWWEAAGRPGIERFGLTVTPDGHHVAWLDDPGQPVN